MDDNKKISSQMARKASNPIKNITQAYRQMATSVYGTVSTDDSDRLNREFEKILDANIKSLNSTDNKTTTSFIEQICSNAGKESAILKMMDSSIGLMDQNGMDIRELLTQTYKNKIIKQNDLHELSNQLIELREAILIFRDAVVQPDLVEDRISRTLSFDVEEESIYTEIVEQMEKKFGLHNKIKNFVTPFVLEYGEYYTYTIPYASIFNDFMKAKNSGQVRHHMFEGVTLGNLSDDVKPNEKLKSSNNTKPNDKSTQTFSALTESVYEYIKENPEEFGKTKDDTSDKNGKLKLNIDTDIKDMMNNISVCNEPVPLNVLDEGFESVNKFMTEFVDDSGNFKKSKVFMEGSKNPSDLFKAVIESENGSGIYSDKKSKNSNEFKNIKDAYVRMLDPQRLIPIEIMNEVIGYYLIQDTEKTGKTRDTMFSGRMDSLRKSPAITSAIVDRIVHSFDKKFLEENIKFKKLIAEAINFYNISEREIRFQFIPAEYITVFKINEDINGNGTSILEPSLFYAKLYLMLLMFKIMSIVTQSNDVRVNYIRQSGIDKDVINKVNEMARVRQSRAINLFDLFSYTNMINKIGNGSEMYVPVGRSGERAIETEILQGQEVQLNTELMEWLRTAYILGTGVPSAIMNYLNEADFAKSIETANTRFLGRVVSVQTDLNGSITEWYKDLLRQTTTLDETVIESFSYKLQPPSIGNSNLKQELISNFESIANFYIGLFFGPDNMNNPDFEPHIREFRKQLAIDLMPMFKVPEIEEMYKQSNIVSKSKILEGNVTKDDEDDMEIPGI